MKFVRISAGTFTMGSDKKELERHGDEDPVRQVTISKDYYIGQYEVKQEQWVAMMGENPSIFTDKPEWRVHPVDNVSWNDCKIFIEKLNALEVGTFRLPTEAEWEYACRAGTTTRFYWGEDPDNRDLHDNAWGFSRAEGRSHPVGLKMPNPWGLYDMSGNVWEWCSDWRKAYSAADTLNPTGPPEGTRKIYRGGSWFNEPAALRSANRHGHPPETRGTNSGLRLVLEMR
jgi:formylglycine-generating enzyme required for sulfatase activity